MANSLVVGDSLIVVPEFDNLVFSGRDKVFTFSSDCERVNFSRSGAIKHTNCLSVEAVPVGNFAVRASGQKLRLIWVVHQLLEHS